MARTRPFEEHPDQYEAWFSEHPHVYHSELEALRNMLPRHGVGVEIGLGSGRFAAPLGIRLGIEPSVAMRRLARPHGLKVACAVAEHLPFRSSSFDYALMVTTICFVDDPAAALREAARILEPDGCLVIGFVDRGSPLGIEYEALKARNVFYREATFYSTREVLALLSDSGYTRVTTVQTVFGRLQDIDAPQAHRPDHGEGGFVVIRAHTPSASPGC